MSNKREIEPSLDYFELRRRHEEYKNSQRQKDAPEASSAPLAEPASPAAPITRETTTPQEASAPVAQPASAVDSSIVESSPVVEPATQEVPAESPVTEASAPEPEDVSAELELSDNPESWAAPSDERDVEDAALLDDALPDDDEQEDEEAAADNPNPFDPFIHAFKGIRGKLAGRFGRRRQEEDYEDDEYPDDDENIDDRIDEAQATESGSAPVNAPESNAAEDAPREDAPVEDVLDEASTAQVAPSALKADNPGDDDSDDGVEDYEDDNFEDEAPEKVSGFKKFMRLFVVRIDDDEEFGNESPDDVEYEDEDEDIAFVDDDAGNVTTGTVTTQEAPTAGVDLRSEETVWAAPAVQDNEGGPDMSDLNNVNTELTDALAAGLETSGMTRRQRRELAQRLAAEKAAAASLKRLTSR